MGGSNNSSRLLYCYTIVRLLYDITTMLDGVDVAPPQQRLNRWTVGLLALSSGHRRIDRCDKRRPLSRPCAEQRREVRLLCVAEEREAVLVRRAGQQRRSRVVQRSLYREGPGSGGLGAMPGRGMVGRKEVRARLALVAVVLVA